MGHSTDNDSRQQASASTSYQHERTEQEKETAFIEEMINSTTYMTPKELLERVDGTSFERWVIYNERANKMDDEIIKAKDKLYAEKLKQFKQELSELEEGTHATLRENLKALEHERDQQLFRINTIAQTRVKHVDNQYELERSMAQEELDTGKRHLRNAWKAYIDDKNAGVSTEEFLPKRKRKESSPRPVLEILKDKIGMMNSVTNRRQAADRMRVKKDRDRLSNSLDTRDENELHTDLLVMRKIVDTHEGYQRSRKPTSTPSSSTTPSSKRHQHDTNANSIRRS
ncbi:hypothetical protein K492DRAFT_233402 [Lichtheimia hyalospora FSU 10163]|nr:hypothetical protein K492DRAFT_233402 [Lichtheimia hyalospora FSU 10163]